MSSRAFYSAAALFIEQHRLLFSSGAFYSAAALSIPQQGFLLSSGAFYSAAAPSILLFLFDEFSSGRRYTLALSLRALLPDP